MQKRLITFGCSVTYGHGLPDCFILPNGDPGPTHSNLAWPALLADSLNRDLVNTSRCGASNLEILHNILNFNFLKTDLVVVMWSFPDRDLIFGQILPNNTQSMMPMANWLTTPIAVKWKYVHPASDLATRSWFYIHHASLYLESLQVQNYNTFTRYNILGEFRPNYLNVSGYFKTWPLIDYALDGQHPGEKTQRFMAEEIKQYIEVSNAH